MSSYTDPLHLNEMSLFRELQDNLPKNVKDTRNILEIRDNVLYVWNAKDFCVVTLNIAATRGEIGDVPYQVRNELLLDQTIELLIGKRNGDDNTAWFCVQYFDAREPNLNNMLWKGRTRPLLLLHVLNMCKEE